MTLYEDLKWRGLIKDVAGEEAGLKQLLDGPPITFYWGTDPTADSLHIGHYCSICMVKRLVKAGHRPILLCGSATGRIGDPRPTAEREILPEEVIDSNKRGIWNQIKALAPSARQVDNYDWWKEMTFLEALRDIGKYINVNYMLGKDIIQRRLETGITFAEFSYMLVQGYDFLRLYQAENCIMQVAGSDQWGNITTGVDLIRKKLDKTAYAFTMPLILDAKGNKFGKTEGNALWLDKGKTSAYEIYQYLLNADDSTVLEYLKVFTFLSKEEIESVYARHLEKPELRIAQRTLAYEVARDLHGEAEADNAVKITEKLFSGEFSSLAVDDILTGMRGAPTFKYAGESNIVDFLADHKIVSSKREARELISANAISVNGEIVHDIGRMIDKSIALEGRIIIIRRGKKKHFIAEL